MTRTPSRVLGTCLALAATACGGGDDPAGPSADPPAATPPATTPPATTPPATTPPAATTPLRQLAAAKGRAFGTALDNAFFAANPTSYRTLVAREFGMVVAANVMKWSSIHRDGRHAYRWENPDAMVDFARANGMSVRGHTLVWHQQNPAWLTSQAWHPDTLKVVLREHIDSVVGHYRGKVQAWDVVNEALNDGSGSLRTANSPWATTLGREYIDLAFRHARAADPAAQLYYNDYNLEFPGAKQDSAHALIQGMKARGVPIDGIGFQGHFQINADGSGVPSRESLSATFGRFAALGLKVQITELDVRVRTPGATATELAAQAQGYANVVGACLATSACDAIVVWGVHDGESWVPSTFPGYGQPLLFDDAFNPKATYAAVRAALGG